MVNFNIAALLFLFIFSANGSCLKGQLSKFADGLFKVERVARKINRMDPKEGAVAINKLLKDKNIEKEQLREILAKVNTKTKSHALSLKFQLDNAGDVSRAAEEIVEASSLSGKKLKKALYRSTRQATVRDQIDFLESLGDGKYELIIPENSNLYVPYAYLGSKSNTPVTSSKDFYSSLYLTELYSGRGKPPRALLVSPNDLDDAFKSDYMIKKIREAKTPIFLHNQGLHQINVYNYANPEIAASVLNEQKSMKQILERVKELGLEDKVIPVYYDGSSPKKILNKRPKGELEPERLADRLRSAEIDPEELFKSHKGQSLPMDLSLEYGHFETMTKLNERIGSLLNQVDEYAKANAYSKVVFVEGSQKKSFGLINKIMKESHGVPDSRWIKESEVKDLPIDERTLIVIPDDFVGSGDQMVKNVERVHLRLNHDGDFKIATMNALATSEGRAVLDKSNITNFIDQEVGGMSKSDHRLQQLAIFHKGGAGWGQVQTITALEYMAPDNNLQFHYMKDFLKLWAPEKGIK